MTEQNPITGSHFIAWLIEQGAIPEYTRRVVIDADYRNAVLIYVEAIGTDNLIKIELPESLKGATVKVLQ